MTMDVAKWLWMAVLLCLWLVIGFRTTPANKGRLWWVTIAALALCVRFMAAWLLLGNQSDTAGTDGLLYHKVAINVMEQLRSGTPVWLVKQDFTWYTLLLGIQYALSGVNRYAGAYMNAFYAVLGGHLLFHIGLASGFRFRKSAMIAAAWLFMPNLIIWTSDTRKESISFLIAFLLWRMILFLLQWQKPLNVQPIFALISICLLLWISTMLRIYMLFPLGGGLMVTFFLHWRKTLHKQAVIYLAIIFASILFIGFMTVIPGLKNYNSLSMEQTRDVNAELKTDGAGSDAAGNAVTESGVEGSVMASAAVTGSGIAGPEGLEAEYRSIVETIRGKNLLHAINGFFTEPHPSEIQEINDLQGQGIASAAVLAEMLLWYLCMMVAIFGMMEATLRGDVFLIGMIVFVLLYSGINILMVEDISDTYYRYRSFIIAPVLLFCDPRPTLRRWFPKLPLDF